MPDAAPVAPAAPVTAPAAVSIPPPATTTAPPAESTGLLSTNLASIRRKERQLQEDAERRKAEYAARDKEHETRVAELKAREERVAALEKAKDRAKLDPMGYLAAADLTYDQLNEAILNGKTTPELVSQDVEARLAALRQELDAKDASREAARKKAEDDAKAARLEQENAAVAQWEKQTTEAITAGGDKYEFLNLLGVQSQVTEAVKDLFETTGKFMAWEEAAEKLEAYYRGVWEKGLESKYYKSKATPKPTETPASSATVETTERREGDVPERLKVTGERPGGRVPMSLDNSLTPSSAGGPPGAPLSRWEQIKASKGFK